MISAQKGLADFAELKGFVIEMNRDVRLIPSLHRNESGNDVPQVRL